MKAHIPFLLIAYLLVHSSVMYSQNQTDFTKVVLNKTYKIVLFDDTEISGTITAVDSANVSVKTHDNMTVIIPKSNILYYSSDLTPSHYKFCLSLLGGVSLLSEESEYNYYGRGSKIGPNINLSGMFFLSDSKAIKFDAGYTFVKAKYDNYNSYYYNDPHYEYTYEGGDASLFSFKGNILFGEFSPTERITYYGSLGLGIHFLSLQEVTEHYWTQNYPDTTWVLRTSNIPSNSEFNAIISVGGSFGYRITKNLGLKAEIEYNLVTSSYAFIFFGGRNYFPVRAGIFYIL